ncbi:MAG: hypothetical protein DRQ39_10545, partial [Gammaproteobacteria bacterium]
MDNTLLIQNYSRLKTERTTLDSTLEAIRRFFVPHRGEFFRDVTTESEVDWRDARRVFDNTGISSADRLAANVQSALTSPSLKWFKWRFRDNNLNLNHNAKTWLEACE